jgi:23S rRNA (uridine2552-2'-O)-methyltransferase
MTFKPREPKTPLKVISKFKIEGLTFARNTKREKVKNKKLSPSSKRWMERHLNDEYRAKAEILGFRARSAFKIIEIQEKFDIFNLGRKYLKIKPKKTTTILDLGCAPGGWSQVILKETDAKVVGVDLLDISPLNGLDFYLGDFCDEALQSILSKKYGKFDLIVSDIAPNATGQKVVDSLALVVILEKEWGFVKDFLSDGGTFVCKVFRSGEEEELLSEIKKHFGFVRYFKPKSSRAESNEFYFIALNFNKLYD